MTEEKASELYARMAFQYEATLGAIVERHLIDSEMVPRVRELFYEQLETEKLKTFDTVREYDEIIRSYIRQVTCGDMVSLTELAKQYSDESPGYVIQSWMRSRNTLAFLRLWENEMNADFDDIACEELIQKARTTSLTITPTLWLRKTHAEGMYVKQGKGGGVRAYPEIAADFHLWLNPETRLAVIRSSRLENTNAQNPDIITLCTCNTN